MKRWKLYFKKNYVTSQPFKNQKDKNEFIFTQVKLAVAKKDDALAQIQEKFKIAICRCQHLEELLDRQQKDLLTRKD